MAKDTDTLASRGVIASRVPGRHWFEKGSFQIVLHFNVTCMRGMAGVTGIERYPVPDNLGDVVEKALETKLQKLVDKAAEKYILLIERYQILRHELSIYAEIRKRKNSFSALSQVDEIWFANTCEPETEQLAKFSLIDLRGVVEVLTFKNGLLKTRQDNRSYLGNLDWFGVGDH